MIFGGVGSVLRPHRFGLGHDAFALALDATGREIVRRGYVSRVVR